MRIILKKPVFEKRDGNWADVIPKRAKQYNNRTHTSSKLTPGQASVKSNE